MCHHIYDSESTQSREAHAAHGISDEVEKGGAEGSESAVSEQAIADGRHAVLSHAEAHVSTCR